MLWIGLTGSIGSGKSTVANLLRKSGYSVVNADAIAHEGLRPGTTSFNEIVKKFSSKILDSDGQINRRELGKLIFSDNSKKEWIENLLHPMVQMKVQQLRKKLQDQGHKIGFYEVPLLFEKNLQSQFDKIIVVAVSSEIQNQRLKLRSSWNDKEIAERNNAQIDIDEKIKNADYVIYNNGTLDELTIKVSELVKTLECLI